MWGARRAVSYLFIAALPVRHAIRHNGSWPLAVLMGTVMSAHISAKDEVLNQLTDADPLWGPLVFLRPARESPFGSVRLFVVCSLFGIFYGMCANTLLALAHSAGSRTLIPVYAAPLFLSVTSFLCGQLFVAAWNRRACQLTRRLAWARATHGARGRK